MLRAPDAGVGLRGGIVALHGSSLPQRDQPLFEHLAATVTPLGFAVASFDRRAWSAGADTPLRVQAADASSVVELLRARLRVPIGLFGFSQGAWSAAMAAADDPGVAFLVLVGCCGVSPAEQMRFHTDELLRRAGYDGTDRAQLRELRLAIEAIRRGGGDRERAGRLLRSAAARPWFHLAYLDSELPDDAESWPDMDYEPKPTFAKVLCPVLLLYGADEECVPADASERAWRRATQASGNSRVTVVHVPGCGHFPAPGATGSSLDVPVSGFSPPYTAALEEWLSAGEAACLWPPFAQPAP
jgi:pimeloyl-ACP methyl ester carboxylesterase